jgi:hypothetical protein
MTSSQCGGSEYSLTARPALYKLGQANLISRLLPWSPKNLGRVGGFYFIIFILPNKNY